MSPTLIMLLANALTAHLAAWEQKKEMIIVGTVTLLIFHVRLIADPAAIIPAINMMTKPCILIIALITLRLITVILSPEVLAK